jgi:hypothetical protein
MAFFGGLFLLGRLRRPKAYVRSVDLRRWGAAALAAGSSLALCAVLACSGGSAEPMNDGSGGPVEVPPWACVPGETQPCPCTDGPSGLLTCDPEGAGFGECDCSPGAVSQEPPLTSTGTETGTGTGTETGTGPSDTTMDPGSTSEPDPTTSGGSSSSGAPDPTTSGGSGTSSSG